jgi:hypothetical protein
VKVVEEPFGGGRRRLAAARVVSERGIDRAQPLPVVLEPPQVGARTAARRPPGDGEECRQAARMLLQQLDAEQLDARRRCMVDFVAYVAAPVQIRRPLSIQPWLRRGL